MGFDEVITVIQTLGFPIACVIACGLFIYKLTTRSQDEAVAREEKLIEANNAASAALDKVANTIEECNQVNKELSETNRLLVDKIENSLNDIGNNVSLVLEKLNS